MRKENLTRNVLFKMTPDDYDNLKKNLQVGQKVSSFIRIAISNELERLELYKKEKNQTLDLD